jgi:hypothetical protein
MITNYSSSCWHQHYNGRYSNDFECYYDSNNHKLRFNAAIYLYDTRRDRSDAGTVFFTIDIECSCKFSSDKNILIGKCSEAYTYGPMHQDKLMVCSDNFIITIEKLCNKKGYNLDIELYHLTIAVNYGWMIYNTIVNGDKFKDIDKLYEFGKNSGNDSQC